MIAEWPLICMAGLLGSSHCVGMCGGFAVMLGLTAHRVWHGLTRQFAYSLGRIFTYAVLGAVAGALGARLSQLKLASEATRIGAGLSLVAGIFLVAEGLRATGFTWRRTSVRAQSAGGCLSTPLLATFLRAKGLHNAFLAGVLTGFLPCGLVYAFLALAAARLHPWEGLAVMTAFGLGTVPLMVATGVGATLLTASTRVHMLRLAAWCVVLTGGITIVRGVACLSPESPNSPPACPFCTARPEAEVAPQP